MEDQISAPYCNTRTYMNRLVVILFSAIGIQSFVIAFEEYMNWHFMPINYCMLKGNNDLICALEYKFSVITWIAIFAVESAVLVAALPIAGRYLSYSKKGVNIFYSAICVGLIYLGVLIIFYMIYRVILTRYGWVEYGNSKKSLISGVSFVWPWIPIIVGAMALSCALVFSRKVKSKTDKCE